MAEKKESKGNKAKEEKKKKKKMMLTIGAFVVAITMVLSGLYMGNNYDQSQKPQQNPVDVFSTFNIKANDVTFYVDNFSDEFIFITNRGFDSDNLNYIKNMSIKGVQKIEITYVDKRYYIFRFKLNNTNFTKEEALDDIIYNFRFLLHIENKDDLLGVYNAHGYGIAKRFKVFAPTSTLPDDIVIGTWYVMTTNKTTENVGLVSKIVEKCNNMSAIVKNITKVVVDGANYDAKILEKLGIKAEGVRIENPRVELNMNASALVINMLLQNLMDKYPHSITKDNISNVSTIKFADFTISVKNLNTSNNADNATLVSFEFNSTKEKMEKILNGENLTGTKIKYSIKPGKITFEVNFDDWNKEIYEKIKNNLANFTIKKEGAVSVAESCVNEKRLVVINNNKNFNAVVNLNRNINDVIHVNMYLYSMTMDGENRYIPYLAADLGIK